MTALFSFSSLQRYSARLMFVPRGRCLVRSIFLAVARKISRPWLTYFFPACGRQVLKKHGSAFQISTRAKQFARSRGTAFISFTLCRGGDAWLQIIRSPPLADFRNPGSAPRVTTRDMPAPFKSPRGQSSLPAPAALRSFHSLCAAGEI